MMCGIVGFLDKTENGGHGPLGRVLLDNLQALSRIGVVADHVPKADRGRTPLIPSVREHNFKRL